ncbi:hypothetical protein J8281_13885 [Aquimarina sp. U1-2]|uniref:hypothetical protein n=1 Tax=Aquimarina sp. U1-2 TaxID=2823141 RepID=UPI001AED0B62|nr:hypothetical protein [Aquimarina sp. U1-2]MBP2833280.1 hypothetical protein [Aquimarina sp. U1-2]
MKTKTKPSHRIIAIFFMLTFLQTLIPYNQLWANNNGPNAPEAASFEPVDATDMVNLLTGDFSYVLPLLNVPSPEGGYPLALAYHAGIAMDQEASWVGLGWNLNPGAINRSVNGFADDFYLEKFHEFFYDRGGSASYYNLSVGYGSLESGLSVGLGFSWGTNRALGGSINLGFGPPGQPFGSNISVGTDGASGGIGYQFAGGLSFGINASTSGNLGVNTGFASNGVGMSVSANTNGTYGVGISAPLNKNDSMGLNFSFSENGVGITATSISRDNGNVVGGGGVGLQLNFDNSIDQGDYNIKQSGYNIPVIVPTPYGVFFGSFGKQKITWFLNKAEQNLITGPLNFNKTISSIYKIECKKNVFGKFGARLLASETARTFNEAEQIKQRLDIENQCDRCRCRISETVEASMDVNEFPLNNENYTSVDKNNVIFPNVDNYNVQAQGISGNLSLKHYENANLFSLSKKNSLFTSSFNINGKTQPTASTTFIFNSRPEFYFENEFSSYLATQIATFNTKVDNLNILDYYETSNPDALPRRKTANYIEYFTHGELSNPNDESLYLRGFIPPGNNHNILKPSNNAIAAFTVTAPDGKKYHYSIPVYNNTSVTRIIGTVENKEEKDAYFEKIQDNPYATHWLLTAITGPDYFDTNGNRKVDESDYGYWVEFDYGKWSEAYGWKMPYGKDYIESNNDENVKTRIEGFKDIYYLDQVKTRTHTAIFSKSQRFDGTGYEWKYNSVNWNDAGSAFTERFKIPSQRSLKLDQIILLKNEDAHTLNKGNGSRGTISIKFPYPNSTAKNYDYNLWSNVFDKNDISSEIFDKAIKVIDFGYRNSETSLVQNTPNTLLNGRLTLNRVTFKGKQNKGCVPPYLFDYFNETSFNLDNKNDWGYSNTKPWDWSLKSIKTPEGSKISMVYESDDFHKPAFQTGRLFSSQLQFTFLDVPSSGSTPNIAPKRKIRIKIEQDPLDPLAADIRFEDHFDITKSFFMDMWFSGVRNYRGRGYARFTVDIEEEQAVITELNTDQNYMIIEVSASSPYRTEDFRTDVNPVSATEAGAINFLGIRNYGKNEKKPRYDLVWREENASTNNGYSLIFKLVGNKHIFDQKEGDIRVKELTVTDGASEYKTKYHYQQNGYHQDPYHSQYRSSGALSYIPNDKNLAIPYAAELPAPKVMYEKVTVTSTDAKGVDQGKSVYTFNVFKEKEEGKIKFGEFFEIETFEKTFYNNKANKNVGIRNTIIHDNLSAVGQLLKLEIFNKKGQLISKIKNEYFGRENRPNNQGIDQQSFQTYKEIDYNEDVFIDKWLVGSSTRVNYLPALKSKTTTAKNQVRTTSFDRYDEVSGATLETSTHLSDQQTQIKSIVIPAYTKYSALSSKVDDINNKNMLIQNAAILTQIKVNNTWKAINTNITTWNNNWTYRKTDGSTELAPTENARIWRKHKTYTWKSDVDTDGAYSEYTGDFDSFNWQINGTQTNPKWINTSTISLYDHYSMPLETIDMNNNKVATKMTDKDSKIAIVANAGYTEMFYSSAEYKNGNYIGNEIQGANFQSNVIAHTGKFSLALGPGNEGFKISMKANDQHRAGQYKISIWVNTANVNDARIHINGETKPFNGEKVSAGNWTQLNHYEELSAGDETIYITASANTIYADDFRLHPIESSMTSYIYNKWDELSDILGSNNLATHYEYDNNGKLKKTYNEVVDATNIAGGLKLIDHSIYRYSNPICGDLGGGSEENEISFSIGVAVPTSGPTGKITVTTYGGSGNFSFRWAKGQEGETGYSHLTFGSWSNQGTIYLVDELCDDKGVPFMLEVRDNVIGGVKSRRGFYKRICNSNGDGGVDGCLNCGEQY